MSEVLDTPTETRASQPTFGERIRKILANSDKPLPFAKIKSAINPKGTKKAQKVLDAVIDDELKKQEGVHRHELTGKDKVGYSLKRPPAPLEDRIFALFENATKLKSTEIKAALAEAPAAARFKTALGALVSAGKLYVHGTGKSQHYSTAAPPPWHETEDGQKKFNALVKATQQLLKLEGATPEAAIAMLRERLGLTELVNVAPPDVSPKPATVDLKDFAGRVLNIARQAPETDRFHGNKVFIYPVWMASQRDLKFPTLSLAEFKQHLVRANSEDLLQLSRADEVHAMIGKPVSESETKFLTATFHFILLEGGNR